MQVQTIPSADRHDQGRRFPIQLKILAVLLALGMLSSILMISTLLRFVNEDKITYIQDLNSDIARHTAEAVGLSILQLQDKMKLLVTAFSMEDLSVEQGQQVVETIFNGYSEFLFATVRMNDKVITRAVRPVLLDIPDDQVAAYIDGREALVPYGEVYQGRVFAKNTSETRGRPTFLLSVPFLSSQHATPIVVTAEIRLDNLLRIVGRSSDFDSIVVDQDGVVLAHSDPARVFSRADLSDLEIIKTAFGSSSRTPIAGTLEYKGADGVRYLGSYAPVGVANLEVVIQKPKSIAYLAAKRLSQQLIKVALLIALAASLISFLFSRMLSRPIRTLSGATARIANGDFDVKIPVHSSDEIGELAFRFEKMADALKQREQELKVTYEQLVQSEKLSAFGQIGAGITHEIKNPLTGIIGFAQFSLRKLTDPKVLEKNLRIIEKEAKRCKDILDNLLRFTRKEKACFETLRIDDCINDTLDLLAHQLEMKNIEIRRSLNASFALVDGNSNQLQQVMMNIVLNAEHAMKENGTLTVESSVNSQEQVIISITDTGCGIKKENLKRLFEPFFTTKEKGVGTGLGLSVSFGIIEQHHGRIAVDSKEGKGTTFHILLPLAKVETADGEREGYNAPSSEPLTPMAG